MNDAAMKTEERCVEKNVIGLWTDLQPPIDSLQVTGPLCLLSQGTCACPTKNEAGTEVFLAPSDEPASLS